MNRARVILTIGLALMDVCWVYPWSVFIGAWVDPTRETGLLSAPISLVLLLLAALTTYLIGRRAGTGRRPKAVLAALAVIAAVITVRVEHFPVSTGIDFLGLFLGALARTIGELSAPVLAFALALYLWYRGVRLGVQTPGFQEVDGAFRWGIGRLAAFGLVMALTRRFEVQTTPFVVGFFFLSLLTLALARLESLRTRTRQPTLNTQWVGVLVLVAGGVILLALLLGQILSFDVLVATTRPFFDLLGAVLLLLLYIVVIPLSYVVEWLIYLVLSLAHANANRRPPQPPTPADVDNLLQRFFAEQMPPDLLSALKAIGAAALVAIGLIILARGLTRWRPSSAEADATNEERDSLFSASQLRALLLAWLGRLFRRGAPAREVSASAEVPLLAEGLDVDSVRALYAQLLRAGETAGAPRAASTTPLEHATALDTVLEPESSIDDITAAYVHVRYGDEEVALTPDLRQRLSSIRPKGADA